MVWHGIPCPPLGCNKNCNFHNCQRQMVQKMSPNWLPWPASDKRCLLAEQWPGLHPNGGNRLSRIREPELFRRFSHSPHFCDNISAAAFLLRCSRKALLYHLSDVSFPSTDFGIAIGFFL